MANVYLPKKGELPTEKMMLAGILAGTPYRKAKGIVEGLLTELNIPFEELSEEAGHFTPNRHIYIKSHAKILGEFGELSQGYLYYEFSVESVRALAKDVGSFKAIPKFPPQIEDLTFTFPARTKIGEIIDFVLAKEKLAKNMELTDTYKDAYTFRLWYQHPEKTLTDKEVQEIRENILRDLLKRYGANLKSR
jgi:phenylalanyl-tRNA synthetase beta chain